MVRILDWDWYSPIVTMEWVSYDEMKPIWPQVFTYNICSLHSISNVFNFVKWTPGKLVLAIMNTSAIKGLWMIFENSI